MTRAAALAAFFLVAASCDSIGAGLVTLGTFDREFHGSLSPVEIPSFDVSELITPSNVRLLLETLGYDVGELLDAGARLSDLQSVVEAARAIGAPLEDEDASIRLLLASVASSRLGDTLTNEGKGRFVSVDLEAMFAEPFDYDRLEESILTRARTLPVEIEVVRRTDTIDELFRGNLELVALVRSGWLASLRVTEIGLRTLFVEEELRLAAGLGLSGALHDPERMDRCVDPGQARIYGVERIAVALRSLEEGAAWVPLLDETLETEHAVCSFRTTMRSPELLDVLAADRGLEVRIRVRSLLPRAPFRLGGYLWFASKSVNLDVGEF